MESILSLCTSICFFPVPYPFLWPPHPLPTQGGDLERPCGALDVGEGLGGCSGSESAVTASRLIPWLFP